MSTRQVWDDAREKIARLVRLQGSDPGFYLLALHSFIEAFLRDRYGWYQRDIGLKDLLYRYREEVSTRLDVHGKDFHTFNQISKAHDLTNGVRHAFKDLEPEEARAATYRFLKFYKVSGIDGGEELENLEKSIRLWEERGSRFDDFQRMNRFGFELVQERQKNKELNAEIVELRVLEGEHTSLSSRLRQVEIELETERTARRSKDERVDELRRERAALAADMKSKSDRIDELTRARDYVLGLTRMSLYTRSRLDFEQELVRLTTEQQRVLDEITLGGDFLVKGGAGTGKTLVLLKALGKLLGIDGIVPGPETGMPSFVLITYSETLVKYDRYVASIISIEERNERIVSVDDYLERKLAVAIPDGKIDFEFFTETVRSLCSLPFITPEDAASELEDFLFANNVSEREYCTDLIERSGMKRRLDAGSRRKLWELRNLVVEHMDSTGRFSRNYSRIRIVTAAESKPELVTDDYMFIDEVQDLAPTDLLALKVLSRKAVIMAGDADQAIFRKGFSFKRIGIDIVGRARTLNLNFRNTLQINELAERFRVRLESGQDSAQAVVNPKGYDRPSQAFRPGPPPELYTAADERGLEQNLLERVKTFLELLQYDRETLTILTPDIESLERVRLILAAEGIEANNIGDESFRFETSSGIRLSTLHLAKGIDFPVVFLYLPYEPDQVSSYDDAFNDTMIRNAMYVCMTRAMEHLNVFTIEGAASPVIRDLTGAFSVSALRQSAVGV